MTRREHTRLSTVQEQQYAEDKRVKPVCLWKVWPNEAHDFTPWLAKHIDWLGDELNLKLERVRRR